MLIIDEINQEKASNPIIPFDHFDDELMHLLAYDQGLLDPFNIEVKENIEKLEKGFKAFMDEYTSRDFNILLKKTLK